MLRYVVTRLLLMIPTLFGIAALVFVLMRVLPGDIIELRFAGESAYASRAAIELERQRLGLDQPLWRQFADWVRGLARLDLGILLARDATRREEASALLAVAARQRDPALAERAHRTLRELAPSP